MRPYHVAIVGSGPSGYFAAASLAEIRRRLRRVGRTRRHARDAAHPVGAGALRRGARPSQDQIDQRPVREDCAGSAVPVLRQHRGRRPCAGRRTGRTLRRGGLRRRRSVRPVAGHPGRGPATAACPPSTSWAGTTLTRTSRRWRRTCRAVALLLSATATSRWTWRASWSPTPTCWRQPISPTTRCSRLHDRGVEEVLIIGRRGPLQAPFTTLELRELGELEGLGDVDVIVDPADFADITDEDAGSRGQDRQEQHQGAARLRRAASHTRGAKRRIVFRFRTSPIEIKGDEQGRVHRARAQRTGRATNGRVVAKDTGEREEVPAQLVVRAVGYRGVPSCRVCRSTIATARSRTPTAASRAAATSTSSAGSSAGPPASSAATRATRRRPSTP